jgi:hypothetical protein
VRIPSSISPRYFLVEARLRVDEYERATLNVSSGIPTEGVVVYEVDESTWAPVKLRTPAALTSGQGYANAAEGLEVSVTTAVPGGFTVVVKSTENPACDGIRDEIASAEKQIETLQQRLHSAAPGEKAFLLSRIRTLKAEITTARQRGRVLGCRLT